jgi:hypothetical protein
MSKPPGPRPTDIRAGKGREPPRLGVPNNPRRGPASITSQNEVTYVWRRRRKRDDQQTREF